MLHVCLSSVVGRTCALDFSHTDHCLSVTGFLILLLLCSCIEPNLCTRLYHGEENALASYAICSFVVQGALSVPHLLVSHVFEEVLHMAAPSEGGRSLCEGMQDELGDILMRTVNIISNFFEMLDLDKNGNVELADLHRMQVRHVCRMRMPTLQSHQAGNVCSLHEF